MVEIIKIRVQVVAKSDHPRKDAIKMLRKLIAKLDKTPRMGFFKERNDIAEGYLEIEEA